MGKGIEEEEKMNQRDGENRVDKCNSFQVASSLREE